MGGYAHNIVLKGQDEWWIDVVGVKPKFFFFLELRGEFGFWENRRMNLKWIDLGLKVFLYVLGYVRKWHNIGLKISEKLKIPFELTFNTSVPLQPTYHRTICGSY